MTVFVAFGAAVGALAGSMPTVMANADVDSQTLGLGLTISTLATVAGMALGGPIARHASNRGVLLAVLPLFAVALALFLASRSPLWLFLAYPPLGLLFGLTDVFMNAEAAAIEHDLKRPVFTGLHAGVSLGIAAMAIAASLLSTGYGSLTTASVMAAVFAVAWLAVRSRIAPRRMAGGRAPPAAPLSHRPALALLGLAAGLIIAGETAALLWSAKFLNELAPALAAIAGIGAAFFGLCNAAIRIPGDRLRTRFGDVPLMLVSACIAAAGFLGVAVAGSFAWSVGAFAAIGLGSAILIPCIFAVAAASAPTARASALGFLSLFTALPRILGPWVFGLVASGHGMAFAFGMMAAGLALAAALLFCFKLLRGA